MSDEWEAMGVSSLAISTMIAKRDSGYEYKVMRRKVKTERDEFIDTCCVRCSFAGTSSDYGTLYDAGARFK
jgi:hypothetical protein